MTKKAQRGVQRWATFGLSDWEDCLVRQQANLPLQDGASVRWEKLKDPQPLRRRCPSTGEWQELSLCFQKMGATDVGQAREMDVVIGSREAWDVHLAEVGTMKELQERDVIRLLWDWSPASHVAMPWTLLHGLHGVIGDAETLRTWVHVAIREGHSVAAAAHPLFANLRLPRLVKDSE